MIVRCNGPVLVAIVVLGLVASCGRRRVELDHQGLDQKAAIRFEEVTARPAVSEAGEAFMEALASDPELQRAGETLLQGLSAEPKIAAAIEQFMESMSELPATQEVVRKLMARNPDASADQIGDLVGEQISSVVDSPQVDAVFGSLGNEIMEGAELAPLKKALGTRLSREISRNDEARWGKRLIELNGGSVPSPARATDLYLEHAWSVPRVERLVIALLENRAVRREAAQFLTAAASDDKVTSQLRRSVMALVQEPQILDQARALISGSLADPRDDAAVAATLRTLLFSEPMLRAIHDTIRILVESPEIGRHSNAAFEAISADPEVRAMFDELMNRW